MLAGKAADGGGQALPAVGGPRLRGGCDGRGRRSRGGRRGGGGLWPGCGRLGHGIDAHHRFHSFYGGAASGSYGGYALHQVASGRSRGRGRRSGGRRGFGCRGGCGWRRLAWGFAGFANLGDGGAHGQCLAFFGEYLEKLSGDGRGDLHGDFVGHHLYEGLVTPDGLARLLEPLADGAFDYGFADVGKFNRYGQLLTTCPLS